MSFNFEWKIIQTIMYKLNYYYILIIKNNVLPIKTHKPAYNLAAVTDNNNK